MIILVSIYFFIYNIYLFIILILNLALSVSNEFIAILDIDRLFILKEEWLESFILNLTVKDMIREIPEYIPIDIPPKKGGLRNID